MTQSKIMTGPDNVASNKVAYFHGCFHNYYYPEVGEALVKVLRKNGVEVIVPEQVCCALPMVSKSNYRGAHRNMERNARVLSRLVADGYALLSTCSSCSLFLKADYPHLLSSDETRAVAENTYHFSEYLLRLNEGDCLDTSFRSRPQTVFYHTPCHLRAQRIGDVTVRLLRLIPGIAVNKISYECCGMGGAYGYEKEHFELSKDIAAKLYTEIGENPTDRIVTDCGGCKLQMEAGTDRKVEHPLILIQEAYGL